MEASGSKPIFLYFRVEDRGVRDIIAAGMVQKFMEPQMGKITDRDTNWDAKETSSGLLNDLGLLLGLRV